MKYFKKTFSSLGIGFYLLLTGCTSQAVDIPETTSGPGYIVLSEVETYGVDPEHCVIPAVPGTYMLNQLTGCYTDDYDLIRFNEVDSGLSVKIMDHGKCTDNKDNWAIEMKTVKQPTTTPGADSNAPSDWISFQRIWATEPDGAVISPGVMKTGRWQDGNSSETPDFINTASCVMIYRH
ncbi:hypothetical protein [Pseudomonas sp. GM78]|uniref:hypothetical protein n=1 Tax=Pseudomonas sp. GM78 TaxID=1144337 RepID=UPI0012F88835|nr:hypothetical protein [Pseudomonas sp. GM78]